MEKSFGGVIVLKYSFLVPVYNVEKYLEQCIESMLAQTYRNFEIILVDDGSTDNSGRICDEYEKKYPDIIKVVHKKNEGLVSAREAGIKNAGGDVCLFVDSDDFIENDLLESVDGVFSSDSDIDIVIFNLAYFENEQKIPRKICFCDEQEIVYVDNKRKLYEALMFSTTVSSLCLKAVKTSLLKNDKTDYSLYYEKNMGEDQFRTIHLFTNANKVCYLNKPFYCYRVDNFSISRDFDCEKISKKNMLYIYDEFIKYLPVWGINDKETVERLQAQWLNVMIYTFSSYYNAAINDAQRKKIIDFSWSEFLPEQNYKNNKYISDSNRNLCELILNKKYFNIKILYLKNSIYKKIKSFLK